jgi:hypothetical protein
MLTQPLTWQSGIQVVDEKESAFAGQQAFQIGVLAVPTAGAPDYGIEKRKSPG